jgi:hypothetical protein
VSRISSIADLKYSKEDFDKAKVLFNDATRSGSYLYPIKASLSLLFAVLATWRKSLQVLTV